MLPQVERPTPSQTLCRLFPPGTYIDTHPADTGSNILATLGEELVTFPGPHPHLPGFGGLEISSGEGVCRAGLHANYAFPTAHFYRPSRMKRSISENGSPPYPWPSVKGDQEAALSYPSQSCQARCHLVRENTTQILPIQGLGSGNGESPISLPHDGEG